MNFFSTSGFPDYKLLDFGHSQRLERFGAYTLIRPDPSANGKCHLPSNCWDQANAIYTKNPGQLGAWKKQFGMPNQWSIQYQDLTFLCKLTPFKHTGVFPEQALNWQWLKEKILSDHRPVSILNLFGYTGAATLAAAAAGALVTHVDASNPAIGWARENQLLSGLANNPIRWIREDALKFVQREIRRGRRYDGIVLDPPQTGHGPNGEVWSLARLLPELLAGCLQLLSDQPLFLLANVYPINSISLRLPEIAQFLLQPLAGTLTIGVLGLLEKNTKRSLSTGLFVRWEA